MHCECIMLSYLKEVQMSDVQDTGVTRLLIPALFCMSRYKKSFGNMFSRSTLDSRSCNFDKSGRTFIFSERIKEVGNLC